MKKKIFSFMLALCLIIPCVFGLSACGSGGNNNSSGTQEPEATMEITGAIPFNLNSDFYFSIEMKPINGAMNPKSATFTAIRKNDDDVNGGVFSSIYANYTYYVYQSFANYQTNTYKEKYVEERTLYEGIDFRKSFAEETNSSNNLNDLYNEDWNTAVPDGTTMTTTIQYIQDFLNGNHVADTPYNVGGHAQTKKIFSDLSTDIHKKDVGIPDGSTQFFVYADGTENMTFDRFENASTVYNESKYSANITKYKGVWYEANVANIKVWGNIVVSATPIQNTTLLKKEISTKFSTEITQETFEATLTACGYTTDPVIPA